MAFAFGSALSVFEGDASKVDVWSDEVNDCRESLYFLFSVIGAVVVFTLYTVLCCKFCRKRTGDSRDVEKSPQNLEMATVETPDQPKREDSPAKIPAEENSETPPPVPKRPSVPRGAPPALPTAPKPRLSPESPEKDPSPRGETESKSPSPMVPFISHLPRESEEPADSEPRESPKEAEPRGTEEEGKFPPALPPEQPRQSPEAPLLPPNLPPELPPKLPPKLPPRPSRHASTTSPIPAEPRPSSSGNSGNGGNSDPEINAALYPKPSRHVEAPNRHVGFPPNHVGFPPSHVLASNELSPALDAKHAAPWSEASVFLNPADVTIAGNRCSLRNVAYEMDVVEMSQVPRLSEAQLAREKEFWSRLNHPGILRVPKIGGISRIVYRLRANRGTEPNRARTRLPAVIGELPERAADVGVRAECEGRDAALRDVVSSVLSAVRYVEGLGEVYGSLRLGNVFWNPENGSTKLELPEMRAEVERRGISATDDRRSLREILKTCRGAAKSEALRTALEGAEEICAQGEVEARGRSDG